jgi:hypothetical protein
LTVAGVVTPVAVADSQVPPGTEVVKSTCTGLAVTLTA